MAFAPQMEKDKKQCYSGKKLMKKFIVLVSILSLVLAQDAPADTTKYIRKALFSLNLSNTTISDNWHKGGNSALSWNLKLDYNFTTDAPTYSWTNIGKFAFGKSDLEGVPNPSRIIANNIQHETVFTKKMGLKVEPFVSASMQTQFTKGYDYNSSPKIAISDFFDPAYFTQAIGFGYTTKDLAFNARAGFSAKQTIADTLALLLTDDPKTADEVEDIKVDYGLKLNFSYTKKYEKFDFKSSLELFSELEAINATDLIFDLTFTSNVTDFLKFLFDLDMRYDMDVSRSNQVMHILSIGAYYDIF